MYTLDFKGKVVLVVGGNGGIGYDIYEKFRESGATSILTYRNKFVKDAIAYKMDIEKETSVIERVNQIIKDYERIDILINAAGINILKNVEDYDLESFKKIVDVNLIGAHLVTREVGKNMIKNKFGRIIHISSVKSFIGIEENYSAYCATKAALNMYSKQVACEWAKYNITSNVIAPTFIETEINKVQLNNKEFKESIINRIPMRRLGEKSDVSYLSLFLASQYASFITGQIIAVDGGLTARQ